MGKSERRVWEEHWQALQGQRSLFGALATLVRSVIFSRAVRAISGRYFPTSGVMVEMGCGTGQASSRIPRQDRKLVGLDFAIGALVHARNGGSFCRLVQGDIDSLPFRDSVLDGVWNLGVMEHFDSVRGHSILREFYRVLKPGAHAILFWPPDAGSSRLVLGPIEGVVSRFSGRRFMFFPDEVNRLKSKDHGRQCLTGAGFEAVRVGYSWRDAFIHIVLVGRKP